MTALSGCQRCGRAVNAGAQFCSNCGADVSAEQGFAATRRMTPASATAMMHNQLLDRLRRASLGEYEILAELGRGGMASVFLAHDLQLDRKVAIKVMLPSLLEGEGMADRFKLEARTAANLSHPHIIPIYAVRDTDLLIYFVMKFVEGRPLDTILRELGQLPIPMAQSILSKIGEALGYAHRQGVVHRDIKPANLMIDVEGQPIVTDFGIAKVAAMSGLTMTGATIGTPTYMSPEQATASPITGASDQYSLGIVAYQMLSGHLPFNGETMVSLLYQHCHERPPSFLHERPDCPPALHGAVMRMLEKRPEDRFPNLEEAVECIGRVSLSFDDPVRTQLVDLAMKGGNRRILEGVKTPRSPIPTRAKAATRGADTAPEPIAQTRAVSGKSRAPLWGALAAVAIVATGLGIWRPWVGAAPTGVEAGAAASVAAAPEATSAAVASLSVSPASGALDVNGSLQLQAAARDPNGQPVSISIVWTSADPAIATVSPTGLVVARAPGTIAIRAVAGGMESSALLTIAPAGAKVAATLSPAGATAVASIRVDGVPGSISVGGTAQLRASALDGRGATMTGRAIRWTSADPTRARISPGGVVTGLSAGDAVFVASSESVDRSVTIQIVAPRTASVAVSTIPGPLTVGSSARLTATAFGDDGRAVDVPVHWRSGDARVATVASGLVTAVGPGSTSIIATADGQEGSTSVRVVAEEGVSRPVADPPRPAVDPREAVEAVIQSYARALESRQIAEVRKVYPGIQPAQESQLADFLRSLDRIAVTLRVVALDVRGGTATANISGQYDFFSRENRRNERLPVEIVATLENGASGWTIRQIRSAR